MNGHHEVLAQMSASVATGTHADRATVTKLRTERLRSLVQHARIVSPFWAERLASVDLNDLERTLHSVPILSREELLENMPAMTGDNRLNQDRLIELAANLDAGDDIYVIATSGSTGDPVRIPVSIDEAALDVSLARRHVPALLQHLGLVPTGLRRASLGAPRSGPHASSLWRRLFEPAPEHELDVTMSLDDIVSKLNTIQPDVLSVYPSVIPMLVSCARTQRLRIRPSILMVGAENIEQDVVVDARMSWGSSIVNQWGSSEVGMLGAGDGRGEGMLLNDDWAVVELLDADGCEVQPGQRFERVVATPLGRRILPIFRYEIQDVGTLLDIEGPLRRISDIGGRARDFLTWPGGTIHPLAFSSVLATSSGVDRFQVRQHRDGIDVLLVHHTGTRPDLDSLRLALLDTLRPVLPTPLVNVHLVDDIPRTGSGKKHLPFLPLSHSPVPPGVDENLTTNP